MDNKTSKAKEIAVLFCSYEEVTETTNEVAIEEPLRVYANGRPVTSTMRLPGEEDALAVGVCFAHGLFDSLDDIEGVTYPFQGSYDRIDVSIRSRASQAQRMGKEDFLLHAMSAVSGESIPEEMRERWGTAPFSVQTSMRRISQLQRLVEAEQRLFMATGCTHGAGLFSGEGVFIAFAEDVGRHNAFDKAIGKALLAGKRHAARIAILTSRLSFEMMQKAGRLGLEIVCAVSAPTSLSIEVAKVLNITLVCFLRGGRANIYSCPERLLSGPIQPPSDA